MEFDTPPADASEATAARRPALSSMAVGLLLVLGYFSLADQVVFRAESGKSFLLIDWRESLFWLSHYLLLVPGLLLLGWTLAPWLGHSLLGLARRLRSVDRRVGLLCLLALGGALWLGSVAGRTVWLLDLPITNDEYTIRFGAQILAEGQIMAPDIHPDLALSMPYVYRRDGRICSMDFPGTMMVLAAAQTTGLGQGLLALLVALSGVALVAACARVDGRRGVLVAAGVWTLSPMVWTLSMTEHSQLVSRICVALAWAAWLRVAWRYGGRPGGGGRVEERPLDDGVARPVVWGLLLGLTTAFGFVSRPAEVGMIMAPVGLHLLVRAVRARGSHLVLASAAGAVALLGPLFLSWWNVQTTGNWRVSTRVLSNRTMGDPLWQALWPRLGGNVGFNIMMLILWFVGPLIAVLVLAAWTSPHRSARGLARLCGASVGLELLLAIFHSDTGNHLVGPIHYSEAAVPLLVLTVLGVAEGWRRLRAWLPAHVPTERVAAAVASQAVAYGLGVVIWSGIHTGTLVDQALVQRVHLDAVADLEPSVVIADRPYKLWFARPELGEIASWVADLPHPDPFLRNRILFAYPEADIEMLRRTFPDRALYRMTYAEEGPPVRLELLASAGR